MRLRLGGAATVAAAITCGILLSAPTTAHAEPDDDGLRWETDALFVLDPADKVVDVSMDITLTNEVPDDGLRYYYFNQIALPLPAEATDIVASVDGTALDTDVESTADPLWSELTVHLSPVLRYQNTQEVKLTFELPDLPPRSDGLTRANPAYATFLAYAYGDPGLVDLEVRVPDRYQTENSGMEMQSGGSGRFEVFTAKNIDDPLASWAAFVARDDGKLKKQELTVDGHEVVVRSWPGDDHWATFVKKNLAKGLPALAELIGQDLPVESLEIIESSTPHVYGYGGFYDSDTDIIEISDQLDAQLVLHELSHAWFNDSMSAEVWLNEGLAEAYAALAVEKIGGSASASKKVSPDDPGAQPLLTWAHRSMLTVDDAEREEYGYAASSWLVHELVDEVGLEAMTQVFRAIADHNLSYPGDTEPTTWSGKTDWRRILDLLQERSDSGDAVELFETFVLRKEDKALLGERSKARNGYAETVQQGDGWSAPYELRDAMSRWRFDQTGEINDAARDILGIRDDALNDLESTGVTALPALETAYEEAASVADVAAQAEQYGDVAAVIGAADHDAAGGDPLSQAVMLALNLNGRIDDAARTLADGDVGNAADAADTIGNDLQNRQLIGGIAIAELLLCLVAARRIISTRRAAPRSGGGRHGRSRRHQRGPDDSSDSNRSGMPSWSESMDSSSAIRR